nr:MASE1 domain-containing protein [Serratia marcescens]
MQTTSLSDTRKIWPALIIFLLVFTLCLLGIVSRPGSFLAIFWPVNAVLLAVLVRRPQWATRAGWGMAVLGYLAADLLTGSSLQKALLLNAANLTGVVVGYLLFMRLSPPARTLQRGASSMYLFGICLAAAATTGAVGAATSQWLFGRPYLTSLALWFSSEFTNYVTLMPFILAFPADWRRRLAAAGACSPNAANGRARDENSRYWRCCCWRRCAAC